MSIHTIYKNNGLRVRWPDSIKPSETNLLDVHDDGLLCLDVQLGDPVDVPLLVFTLNSTAQQQEQHLTETIQVKL